MTHHTDFKQLSGLCLYTLGSINDHDCRICCHQRTVRSPLRSPDDPVCPGC